MGTTACRAMVHRIEGDSSIKAEGERLNKVDAVHEPEVGCNLSAVQKLFQSLLGLVSRDMERPCIVIARAQGDGPQCGAGCLRYLHEAVDCFVDDAVSAEDEHSIVALRIRSDVHGIAWASCQIEIEGWDLLRKLFEPSLDSCGTSLAHAASGYRIGNEERMS